MYDNNIEETHNRKHYIHTREIVIYAMLGAIMYLSKVIMEFIPNVHLLGTLVMAYTLVYRQRALYPIYTYVFLNGALAGFNTWWIPYLYVWTILWGATMLLPKRCPKKLQTPMYMAVCALHGFAFGILYAPALALIFGLNFEATLAWIARGFPFDVIHGVGNFCCGILIVPIANLLRYLEGNRGKPI